MTIKRFAPLIGVLFLLAGCGEDTDKILKEAMTAAANRPFSNISGASWSNQSCKSSGNGYSCSMTLTYKNATGVPYTKDLDVEIQKTDEGWRLTDENIFYGGQYSG